MSNTFRSKALSFLSLIPQTIRKLWGAPKYEVPFLWIGELWFMQASSREWILPLPFHKKRWKWLVFSWKKYHLKLEFAHVSNFSLLEGHLHLWFLSSVCELTRPASKREVKTTHYVRKGLLHETSDFEFTCHMKTVYPILSCSHTMPHILFAHISSCMKTIYFRLVHTVFKPVANQFGWMRIQSTFNPHWCELVTLTLQFYLSEINTLIYTESTTHLQTSHACQALQ